MKIGDFILILKELSYAINNKIPAHPTADAKQVKLRQFQYALTNFSRSLQPLQVQRVSRTKHITLKPRNLQRCEKQR